MVLAVVVDYETTSGPSAMQIAKEIKRSLAMVGLAVLGHAFRAAEKSNVTIVSEIAGNSLSVVGNLVISISD